MHVGVGLADNVVDELALILTDDSPVPVVYTETDADAETDVDSDPDIVGILPPNTCADTRGVIVAIGVFDIKPEYE